MNCEPLEANCWSRNATQLAEHAFARFVNRDDVHGAYRSLSNRKKGKAYTSKNNLEKTTLERHFRGEDQGHIIGVHLLSASNTCKFIAIDIDNHGDDDPEAARKNFEFARSKFDGLRQFGFEPLLLDSDGNGSFHLLIFFSSPIDSQTAFRFGQFLLRGHEEFGIDEPETFPKQGRLGPGQKFGNWLRLPGRHHTRDHWSKVWDGEQWLSGEPAIQGILSHNGDDPALIVRFSELGQRDLYQQASGNGRSTDSTIGPAAQAFGAAVDPSTRTVGPTPRQSVLHAVTEAETIPEGSRNETLFRFACSLANKFVKADGPATFDDPAQRRTLLELVQSQNQIKCCPPLDEDEVSTVVESAISYAANDAVSRNGGGSSKRVATQYRSFPVQLLPTVASRFVEAAASSIGCDPSFVAIPLLVSLASAIGNTRRIRLKKGWLEPAILWAAIVGDSGSMKSPAFQAANQFVMDHEDRNFREHEEELKTYEANKRVFEEWKKEGKKQDLPRPEDPGDEPVGERVMCSDITVEAIAVLLQRNKRGLLLSRDELSGWLRGFDQFKSGKSDVAHWLEMHGGRALVVDRKSSDKKTLYVPRASVCITGGIQPHILRVSLAGEHFQDGLAARLLMVMPPRVSKRWYETEIPSQVTADLGRVFDQLYSLEFGAGDDDEQVPISVELSPEAKQVFIKFVNEHGEQGKSKEGPRAAMWSKIEAYAARFALVFHLVEEAAERRTGGLVQADVVERAIELARWFAAEAERIYSIMHESDDDKATRQIVEFVQLKGPSSIRDIKRSHFQKSTTDELEKRIHAMVKNGWLKSETKTHGEKGGRPVTLYSLADSARPACHNSANPAENEVVDLAYAACEEKNDLSTDDKDDSETDSDRDWGEV